MNPTVLNKKSSVLDKIPSSDQCDFGELCINYAAGDGKSFFATKKSDNTIATFHEDAYWESKIAELTGNTVSYSLEINENGIVNCIKNGTDNGFQISNEGVVSLG